MRNRPTPFRFAASISITRVEPAGTVTEIGTVTTEVDVAGSAWSVRASSSKLLSANGPAGSVIR
ncbi:MAG: hypothetical protein FWJ70_09210 [Micromonosporaceae bacterium]